MRRIAMPEDTSLATAAFTPALAEPSPLTAVTEGSLLGPILHARIPDLPDVADEVRPRLERELAGFPPADTPRQAAEPFRSALG